MNHVPRVAASRFSPLLRFSQKLDLPSYFVSSFSFSVYYSTNIERNPSNSLNQESLPSAPTVWPRPREIPWQKKISNSVNLIGTVQVPVLFKTSSDGKSFASTVVAQYDRDSSGYHDLWIPVIFEGDLAHIAACHVKEKDVVFIAGRLSMDVQPSAIRSKQANMQILVNDINFVHGSLELKKSFTQSKLKKHEVHPFRQKEFEIHSSDSMVEDGETDTTLSHWRDLVKNPKNWWDYREMKLKKMVKEKFPDFKHKRSGFSLWLNDVPNWVLSGLEGLEFDTAESKKNKEYLWKSLAENPEEWWDNRSTKVTEKHPDFRHKETGEGLWVNSLPDWVLSKLPISKANQSLAAGKKDDLSPKAM